VFSARANSCYIQGSPTCSDSGSAAVAGIGHAIFVIWKVVVSQDCCMCVICNTKRGSMTSHVALLYTVLLCHSTPLLFTNHDRSTCSGQAQA